MVEGGEAMAIAVADYTVAEAAASNTTFGADFNWDYIYQYQYASSVAVDHYWILTAAHVADDGFSTTNLTINGELYTQQEIVYHDEADLALVRYDKPFPGYYHLHGGEIYTATTNIVQGDRGRSQIDITYSFSELIMVGFGYAGTVTNDSFTSASPPWIKRWGTNRGSSAYETKLYDAGGTVGVRSVTCFSVSFDLDDTEYEAGANIYDSGGPYLIQKGGEWKVCGINLLRGGTNPYTGNYAAQISEYVDWIKSVISDYDTDMDGLPDHWEETYGEMDAEDDPDEDGFANYEEWIADTDPSQGSSFLAVGEYTNATSLVFHGSTNRQYQIEYRTNLTTGAWMEEGGWFPGAGAQTVQPVSTTDSNRFYRVRAKLY
jgi:hypothetical protein